MAVGIRELARQASQIIERVETTRRPALITRHGRPVAALVPVDEGELEDWILANAPEFVRSMRQADREIARGQLGKPLEQILSQIEAKEERKKPRRRRA
jgi:prevent-host-death family protein